MKSDNTNRVIATLIFGIGAILFAVAALFGVYFKATEVTFTSLSLFCLILLVYVWVAAMQSKVKYILIVLGIFFLGFGILNHIFKWG